MAVRDITEGVLSVGVIDWNREIFDELVPLPWGTSYNSYLVKGSEKTALIDTVDEAFDNEFVANLINAGAGMVDYIVVNHAEQDHSGALPLALELFPMATVVTTPRCRDLLISLLQIPEQRITVVEDGEELSLGNKTLRFIHAPWVHWPETMLTYLVEDRVLFSCDLFGSHLATSDLFAGEGICAPEKRYFAEIMMPFRKQISEHLARLEGMEIDFIAPSHGPAYDKPEIIMNAYREWASDDLKNLVLIPYVSMHGSTAEMVKVLSDALIRHGVGVLPIDLARQDTGRLAEALLDAATIVLATPTVLKGPHPLAANAAFLVNMLKPKARCAAIIGSYGWGGRTLKVLTEMMPDLEAEMLDPVYIKGMPNEEARAALECLADDIFKRHQDYNIV